MLAITFTHEEFFGQPDLGQNGQVHEESLMAVWRAEGPAFSSLGRKPQER